VLSSIKHRPFFAKIKIILLDEADGLTPDAQDLLKRPMEKSTTALFVLCCNDIGENSKAIRSRCAVYEFTAPPVDATVKRLIRIYAAENQDIPENILNDISIQAAGDIRYAVNELQRVYVIHPYFKLILCFSFYKIYNY
jgi:DNA polymerase III delta prime subunit